MAKKGNRRGKAPAGVKQWSDLGNDYSGLGGRQNTGKAQRGQVATTRKAATIATQAWKPSRGQ